MSRFFKQNIDEPGPDFRGRQAFSSIELNVLSLLVRALSNQRMAEELDLRFESIKTCMKNIISKLASTNRSEAVVDAIKYDFVITDDSEYPED